MRNLKKPNLPGAKRLFLLAPLMTLMLLAGSILITPAAHAFPNPVKAVVDAVTKADEKKQIEALQKYCKQKISGKAQSACDAKTMGSLRDYAAGQCKGKKGDAADKCIQQAGKDVIDNIAKQNPKDAQAVQNAVNNAGGNGGNGGQGGNGGNGGQQGGSVQTCSGTHCVTNGGGATPTGQGKNCSDSNCDLVGLYVNPFINLLSVVVGLVVTGSLIMGGIQYAASSGDPQKTGAAKTRIQNTLVAFLFYAFMYAFLNFLIPGGLF